MRTFSLILRKKKYELVTKIGQSENDHKFTTFNSRYVNKLSVATGLLQSTEVSSDLALTMNQMNPVSRGYNE